MAMPVLNPQSAWVQFISESGEAYYYNESTDETTWEAPAEGVCEFCGQSDGSDGSDDDNVEVGVGGDAGQAVETPQRALFIRPARPTNASPALSGALPTSVGASPTTSATIHRSIKSESPAPERPPDAAELAQQQHGALITENAELRRRVASLEQQKLELARAELEQVSAVRCAGRGRIDGAWRPISSCTPCTAARCHGLARCCQSP
jgi:hypothetical protein